MREEQSQGLGSDKALDSSGATPTEGTGTSRELATPTTGGRSTSTGRSLAEIIKLLCFVAVSGFVCIVLWELHGLVRDVRQHTTVTLENLDRNLIILGVTLTEVQKGAKEWQIASAAQSKSATAVLGSVQATSVSLQTLVKRTDVSLNDLVLPNLAASVNEQNQSLSQSQAQLRASLAQLQQTLMDADTAIADPAIAKSLTNIEGSTAQLNASLTDVRQMADKARQTYLKPVNLWFALVKELLPLAGGAAQVVK